MELGAERKKGWENDEEKTYDDGWKRLKDPLKKGVSENGFEGG